MIKDNKSDLINIEISTLLSNSFNNVKPLKCKNGCSGALLKANIILGIVEVKCKKCGEITTFVENNFDKLADLIFKHIKAYQQSEGSPKRPVRSKRSHNQTEKRKEAK